MKKMPFGEADFLVRVMTRDFGKMDFLARGARKTNSKLNFHLDILNHIRVMFLKNGKGIPTLMDAEELERHDDWFLDAEKIGVAGRVIRTLDILLYPMFADEELFLMLLKFFQVCPGDTPENEAVKFLKEVFMHEGHGNTLPPEAKDNIIKLWPSLIT